MQKFVASIASTLHWRCFSGRSGTEGDGVAMPHQSLPLILETHIQVCPWFELIKAVSVKWSSNCLVFWPAQVLSTSVLCLLLSSPPAAAPFANWGGHTTLVLTVTLSSLASAHQQPDTGGVECDAEVGSWFALLYS